MRTRCAPVFHPLATTVSLVVASMATDVSIPSFHDREHVVASGGPGAERAISSGQFSGMAEMTRSYVQFVVNNFVAGGRQQLDLGTRDIATVAWLLPHVTDNDREAPSACCKATREACGNIFGDDCLICVGRHYDRLHPACRSNTEFEAACQRPPPAPNVSQLVPQMLDTVFAHQLPNGNWPWFLAQNYEADPNCVQFTALPILRLLVERPDLLPVGWIAQHINQLNLAASASIEQAFPPPAHEGIPPSYTNMWTRRMTNLHLFAQVTQNATVAEYASKALSDWTAMVDGAGVHEFSSPTYTAVTLVNLFAGAASIHNATAAATMLQYARFIQMDAAASYSVGSRSLAGAHSRDYDFLYGSAGIDWWFVLSGLTEQCDASAAGMDAWLYPDSWMTAHQDDNLTKASLFVQWLRAELPAVHKDTVRRFCGDISPVGSKGNQWHVLRASYMPRPGQVAAEWGEDRYTFVAQDGAFSIGTASDFYGQQDKLILGVLRSANTGGFSRAVQVNVIADRFDNPYGRVLVKPEYKPWQLTSTSAIVQDGATVFAAADL